MPDTNGIRNMVRGNKFVIVCMDCNKVVPSVTAAPDGTMVCEPCLDARWAEGREAMGKPSSPEPIRGIIEEGLEKKPVEAESVEAAQTRQELEQEIAALKESLEAAKAKSKPKKKKK